MAPRARRFSLDDRTIEVVEASITDIEDAHVIVSPDDNYLSHGGGASQAIWLAAGEDVLEEEAASARPTLKLGDVFKTSAGELGALRILHAITIDFDANRLVGPREARELWASVLSEADRIGTRVASPLLGAGTVGLGVAGAAAAAVDAIFEHLLGFTRLERITLAVIGGADDEDDAFTACSRAIEARFDGTPSVLPFLVAPDAGPDLAALRDLWVHLGAVADASEYATVAVQVLGESLRVLGTRYDVDTFDGKTLGSLAIAIEKAMRAFGRHPGGGFSSRVVTAIEARNRLAHARLDEKGTVDDARAVVLGVRAIVQALGASVAPRPRNLPVWALCDAVRADGQQVPRHSRVPEGERREPEPNPAGTTSVGAASPQTAPVRRLQRFLLETLDDETARDLDRRLHEREYQGDRELRILEYCVRMEDPVDFLADRYTALQLRKQLARQGIAVRDDEPDGARALATRLLDFFGFATANIPPVGLEFIRKELEKQRQAARVATTTDRLTALVIDGGRLVEHVAKVLLRFVCEVVFKAPAIRVLLERGWTDDRGLERPLGALLELLERLAQELEQGSSPGIEAFQLDFRTRRLSPHGAQGIAELRNRFAHAQAPVGEKITVDEARVRALRFFEGALELVGYLGAREQRVFPIVIAVEATHVDRWGRRTVIARSDEDHEELLFTDKPLAPGEVYFMHPLTNPMRVDPILVAAGDLARTKG